jgi:hypothetical protein
VDPGSFMVHARTIRAEYLAGLVRSVVAAITPGGRRGR